MSLVKIDVGGIDKVNAMIERAVKETGRCTKDALSWAALTIAESGRSISKPKRSVKSTYHAIIKNPNYRQYRSKFNKGAADFDPVLACPYWIVKLSQGGRPTRYLGTFEKDPKKDPFALIKMRGLASASWNRLAGAFGGMASWGDQSTATANTEASKWARGSMFNRGQTAFARLQNRISYMETAFPGIVNESIARGGRALEGKINREVAQLCQRANAA